MVLRHRRVGALLLPLLPALEDHLEGDVEQQQAAGDAEGRQGDAEDGQDGGSRDGKQRQNRKPDDRRADRHLLALRSGSSRR
ncbi:MAG: hypothetical protein NVV73_03235 [Cellvibrionaceae bacterium]|nr:hypothetical protein [Cellvibrionaceae bacterium]